MCEMRLASCGLRVMRVAIGLVVVDVVDVVDVVGVVDVVVDVDVFDVPVVVDVVVGVVFGCRGGCVAPCGVCGWWPRCPANAGVAARAITTETRVRIGAVRMGCPPVYGRATRVPGWETRGSHAGPAPPRQNWRRK
jgi:hypothetical protein